MSGTAFQAATLFFTLLTSAPVPPTIPARPEVQKALEAPYLPGLVPAQREQALRRSMDSLRETPFAVVLPQLVAYCAASAPDEDRAAAGRRWVEWAAVREMRPGGKAVRPELIRYLSSGDGDVRRSATALLRHLDADLFGPGSDDVVDGYKNILKVQDRDTLSPELIRYLYASLGEDADPGSGFRIVASLAGYDRPRLELAVHVIDDSRWRERNEFLPKGKATEAACTEFRKLATDHYWWVRYYAARLAADEKSAAFYDAVVVDRLIDDKNALVREAAQEAKQSREPKKP